MVQEMPGRDPAGLGSRLFADDSQYMLIKGVYNLKKKNRKKVESHLGSTSLIILRGSYIEREKAIIEVLLSVSILCTNPTTGQWPAGLSPALGSRGFRAGTRGCDSARVSTSRDPVAPARRPLDPSSAQQQLVRTPGSDKGARPNCSLAGLKLLSVTGHRG